MVVTGGSSSLITAGVRLGDDSWWLGEPSDDMVGILSDSCSLGEIAGGVEGRATNGFKLPLTGSKIELDGLQVRLCIRSSMNSTRWGCLLEFHHDCASSVVSQWH